MNRRTFIQLAAGAVATTPLSLSAKAEGLKSGKKPNLVIVHTDEHNFRTLGCYRKLLSNEDANVWGEGANANTPHTDKLAEEGALCTNFYAASPVCTPSRASFLSGLYPHVTGASSNHKPLNDNVVTFAKVLKDNGYSTSYVGKWHLDGHAKPGFAPQRKFGWTDNRFMINRGHWKMFEMEDENFNFIGTFNEKKQQYKYNIKESDPVNYATDFLMDRTLEIIDRDKEKPFCVMLSIPDPHDPNFVREPYASKFKGAPIKEPKTAALAKEKAPAWNSKKGKNWLKKFNTPWIEQYFGMVECIDENLGKLMDHLKKLSLEENTIVIFTADHGEMLGEHNRKNKGVPYEASACVPFIIKYPESIKAGKLVKKAYTTTDFAPTILGLMGVDHSDQNFHGEDHSKDFVDQKAVLDDDRIVYFRQSGYGWIAAVNNRCKLVLCATGEPYLYDLEKDPQEKVNEFKNPAYAEVAKELTQAIKTKMAKYKDPVSFEKLQLA